MTAENQKTYKLGIALSGGGARGFAHAGVLKALEEAGYRPDVISGVSAGSIVGVLYAAGLKADDILKLFSTAKFRDLCSISIRNGGVLDMSRFKRLLLKTLGGKTLLEELEIPMFIGATDFDNGHPAVFSSGAIGERVQASCSIPIAFKPVKIDGVNYVDGGVLRNLPAWIIRDKCERLIGVNCSPMVADKYSPKSMLDIAIRAYNMLAKSSQVHDMEMCDLVISTTDIARYKVFDLKGIKKCFQCGYESAKKAMDGVCWLSDRPEADTK